MSDSEGVNWKNGYVVAQLGNDQSFGKYLWSYERAVECLYSGLECGNEPPDIIAPALLFNMRHVLELGYKYTLWELHSALSEPYDQTSYRTHTLAELHTSLCEQHERVVEGFELPADHVASFEQYCRKTKDCITKFELLDRSSCSFRYPYDSRSGNPHFQDDEVINLRELKTLFDEAMVLLRCTADVLDEYLQIYRHLESEAGWSY